MISAMGEKEARMKMKWNWWECVRKRGARWRYRPILQFSEKRYEAFFSSWSHRMLNSLETRNFFWRRGTIHRYRCMDTFLVPCILLGNLLDLVPEARNICHGVVRVISRGKCFLSCRFNLWESFKIQIPEEGLRNWYESRFLDLS